jgi:prepilin-type N-terminal cleavage/methylation domain-containing protein
MKKLMSLNLGNKKAFTLIEVLISMVIVGIIGSLVFTVQSSTWKTSTSSNRAIVAGHMIQQQIELMRMNISQNQDLYFPPVSGSLVQNGVTLSWLVSNALRPSDGAALANVKKCDFIASWSASNGDTLKATTFLSKMF